MSASGHVWTAPWQELSDIAAALVGCGHVSGLFARPVRPLALMLARIGSQSKARIQRCDDPNGFSRSPVRPCLHYVVSPRQFLQHFGSPLSMPLPAVTSPSLNAHRFDFTQSH